MQIPYSHYKKFVAKKRRQGQFHKLTQGPILSTQLKGQSYQHKKSKNNLNLKSAQRCLKLKKQKKNVANLPT